MELPGAPGLASETLESNNSTNHEELEATAP
jgi:hypothetical protein